MPVSFVSDVVTRVTGLAHSFAFRLIKAPESLDKTHQLRMIHLCMLGLVMYIVQDERCRAPYLKTVCTVSALNDMFPRNATGFEVRVRGVTQSAA